MLKKSAFFLIIYLCYGNMLAHSAISRQQWAALTEHSNNTQLAQTEEITEEVTEEINDTPFGTGQSATQAVAPTPNTKSDITVTEPPTPEPKATADINAPENYTTEVLLQGLDKITARTSKFKVKKGSSVRFGNLNITLHACWKSPPEEAQESKALLEMWEEIPGESRKKIWSGWMFASSPLLSAPEHLVYDITVLECTGITKPQI